MADTITLTYLTELVGRVIKVNKAGPDSRVGRLLAANENFLTLQTKDQQVVYYQLRHVKAVVEDTKANIKPEDYPELNFDVASGTFAEVFTELLQGNVQINGGGPASRVGKLLAVNTEFLTLETKKDGLVMYSLEHVKSVNAVKQEERECAPFFELDPEYVAAVTLPLLLEELRRQWVTVNNGPDKIEGVLTEFDEETLVIVHDKEVFFVSTFHLQSIAVPIQGRGDDDSEDENSDDNSNSNSQNNNARSSSTVSTRNSSRSNVYRNILRESLARAQAAQADTNR